MADAGADDGTFSDNKTKFFNLDVVISVGYRVKSRRGAEFRKWAKRSALYGWEKADRGSHTRSVDDHDCGIKAGGKRYDDYGHYELPEFSKIGELTRK